MQSNLESILPSVSRGQHSISFRPHRALPERQFGRSFSHLISHFVIYLAQLKLNISCKALFGECCKNWFSLIDLDKHVSVNTNPIPSRVICCIYSYVLQGKAKKTFLQLYEQQLSRFFILFYFFLRKLSLCQAGGMRKISKCFQPGGFSYLHNQIWSFPCKPLDSFVSGHNYRLRPTYPPLYNKSTV